MAQSKSYEKIITLLKTVDSTGMVGDKEKDEMLLYVIQIVSQQEGQVWCFSLGTIKLVATEIVLRPKCFAIFVVSDLTGLTKSAFINTYRVAAEKQNSIRYYLLERIRFIAENEKIIEIFRQNIWYK